MLTSKYVENVIGAALVVFGCAAYATGDPTFLPSDPAKG
jgi:hypothetical protein